MKALDWQGCEANLREEWERRYGSTGLQWGEIRDAHHFGWEAALRPEFAGWQFEDVETDISNHWYQPLVATEETAWDYVREAVAEGWRQARERSVQRSKEA